MCASRDCEPRGRRSTRTGRLTSPPDAGLTTMGARGRSLAPAAEGLAQHPIPLRTGERRAKVAGLADVLNAPTVLDDFTGDMLHATEETLGPVSPLRRFDTKDEAIPQAGTAGNSSRTVASERRDLEIARVPRQPAARLKRSARSDG